MSAICTPCAEARTAMRGTHEVSMWTGECDFCGEVKACCDTRDWHLDNQGQPRKRLSRNQLLAAVFLADA